MAATTVGEIGLDLVVNQNQFKTQMAGIGNVAKKAGMALAAAFSVKKIVDFGKSCLELGSDLAEVQNVVDVTFPSMTAQVDKFAQSAAKSFGLSETMAKQYTGTFGAMAKAFGFTEKQAYDMSTTLTGLAGDVASFYNISQDEAYIKLKSVFTGETESLKDLGVVMTQTALDAYAIANGFGKTTAQMSEAEKVALRYAFVQDQLTAATGDFSRTADSWANQCRIMKLQFDSLKASIGQGLINLFTPVLRVINSVIGRLTVLASAFKSFTELITGKKSSTQEIADAGNAASAGMDSAAESADNAAKSTNKTANAAKKAAKEMRSLMGFDKINKLDKKTSDTSSTSGNNVPSTDFGSLNSGKNSLDKVNDSAKKLESSLGKIWKSFEDAWKAEGQNTIAAAQYAFNNVKKLAGSVAKSMASVWTNGTGTKMLTTMLRIAQNVLKAIGNIAKKLDEAWNKNDTGTGIIQAIADIYQTILNFVEKITEETADWAGNLDFYPLLNSIKKLLESISPLAEETGNYVQFLYEKIVLPSLKWLIETGIPTLINILSGFFNFLGKHQWIIDTIGSALIGAFAAGKIVSLIKIIKGAIGGLIGLFTGPKGLLGGISAIVSALGGPLTIAIAATITAALLLYKNWDKVKGVFKTLWQNVLKPFASWVKGSLSALITPAIKKIEDEFSKWYSTASKVVKGITNILKGLTSFLTGVFSGDWKKAFSGLKSIASGFKTAFSATWNFVKDTTLKGVSSYLDNKFGPGWRTTFDALKSTVGELKTRLKDVFKDSEGYFNGVVSFINNKFLKKWQKAWKSIKDTFANVFSGLGSLAKKPVNAIISAFNSVLKIINSLISKINSIKFTIDVPDWIPGFGGSSWGFRGFSIPKMSYIPALAQGAYVKPNTPQLAMIGDNMHQGEFVAPEGKLKEMAKQAVREAGGVNKEELELIINKAVTRIVTALMEMGFYVDSEQIGRAARAAQMAADRRFNAVEVE